MYNPTLVRITHVILSIFALTLVSSLFCNSYLRSEELTGDINDVKRLSTQCLNSTAGKRLISKQEAVCMTAELPFTSCTETIETVPISNSTVLRYAGEEQENKKFIERYRIRPHKFSNLSMHLYFDLVKNPTENRRTSTQNSVEERKEKRKRKKTIIPFFSGLGGYPSYPPTEAYARHSIIVHKAWRTDYPVGLDWIAEFEAFVLSDHCPASLLMEYDRVKIRYYDQMTGYNPKASMVDHTGNSVDDEDMDLMELCGLADSKKKVTDYDTQLVRSLPRGTDFKWDKAPVVSLSVESSCCVYYPDLVRIIH